MSWSWDPPPSSYRLQMQIQNLIQIHYRLIKWNTNTSTIIKSGWDYALLKLQQVTNCTNAIKATWANLVLPQIKPHRQSPLIIIKHTHICVWLPKPLIFCSFCFCILSTFCESCCVETEFYCWTLLKYKWGGTCWHTTRCCWNNYTFQFV